MAKQEINLGTPDKGDGDPLRVAFAKVNANFTELYTSLGIDGSVFDPLSIDSNLVPKTNNTYDLGTPSKQWRHLYVSNNTIYINNVPLGLDENNNLKIDGDIYGGTAGGNVYISASAPVNPNESQLWFNSEDGRMYVRYNGNWVDVSSPAAGTNALIYTGATPPASPIANELWFNTEDGKIYIRYQNTWIDTSVPAAGGGTGDITFVAEEMYRLAGLSISNKDGSHNPTAFINIPANGNDDIELRSLYGGVTIGTGPNNVITSVWNFDDAGILRLPNDAYIEPVAQSINIGVQGRLQILTDAASNQTVKTFLFDSDGSFTAGKKIIFNEDYNYIQSNTAMGQGDGLGLISKSLTGFTVYKSSLNSYYSWFFNLGQNEQYPTMGMPGGGYIKTNYSNPGGAKPLTVRGNGSVTIKADNTDFVFGTDGKLTVPGEIWAKAGDDFNGITFSPDASAVYATLKVDTGANMVLNNYQNIYIKRSGSDRLAITDTAITLKSQDGTKSWAFGEDGHLTLPYNGDFAHIQAGTDKSINIQTTGTVSRVQVTPTDGVKIYTNNDANGWIFTTSGAFQPPLLNTARGDNPSGSVYGYTLNLGDGLHEAVITTPDGTESSPFAQRLVINPGKGHDGSYGEGGDIYLWAGRGGTGDGTTGGGSGGDIKIRGGQGMAGNDGGYIRIEAGDSNNDAGNAGTILLKGGQTSGGTPGYINIQGGYNSGGLGGNIELRSGYGSTGYGNVVINTTGGINLWTFDKDGVLTLPNTAYIESGKPTIQTTQDFSIGVGNPQKAWNFDQLGALTIPGTGPIQTEFITSYRGLKASLNQIYGNDPSINQIVITDSPNITGNDPYPSTNDDRFTVSGLSQSTFIAVVNLYGYNDSSKPIPKKEIIKFVKKYIDLVLYNGNSLRNSIADIQTAFNSNQSQLINSMSANILRDDVGFNGIAKVIDTNGLVHTGSGSGLEFYLSISEWNVQPGNFVFDEIFSSGIFINSGTGYQNGDTITVPGTVLGGISPADDMTVTITDAVDGAVNLVNISFTMAENRWRNVYVKNFIYDGNQDIYDQGNFLGTNLSRCAFTASSNAQGQLVVSAVSSGSLRPFMMFDSATSGDILILKQISGDPGGIGTYVVGGYSNLASNTPSTNYIANGIEYGINQTLDGADIFGPGSSYGSMVNPNHIGIFSLVALNTSISQFSSTGNTGSDGYGAKETTPILYLGQDISLEANSNTWTFDRDGDVVLPNLSSIGSSALQPKVNGETLSLTTTLDLKPNGIYDKGIKIYSTNDGQDNDINISAGPNRMLKLGDDASYLGVDSQLMRLSIDRRGWAPPTKIWFRGAGYSAIDGEYTFDSQASPPKWYKDNYNPVTDPYIEFSDYIYKVIHPNFAEPLYANYDDINVPNYTWEYNLPEFGPAPQVYYKFPVNEWLFENSGNLTVPGDIYANQGNDLNIKVFNSDAQGGTTFSVQNRQVNIGNAKTTQFDVTPTEIVLTTDFNGAVTGKKEWHFDNTGAIIFPDDKKQTTAYQTTIAPTSSKGVSGDKAGMVAFDNTNFYYCKQDYTNGVPDIWVKTAWTSTSW